MCSHWRKRMFKCSSSSVADVDDLQMPLRWGIVTAGSISHEFVNAFNSYPDIGDQKIVAVAARDKTKAKEFAKLYDIEKVFNTYQDLALSNDIDVVYIGAINPDHYPLSKMFLENGKHVLCEKPLCLNYIQAKSLIDLAKKKKLFLMEAVWSRFAPSYQALEQEIKSGKLGDVQYVEANFGAPIENVDRLRLKELGGSALLDVGIYLLQFSQFIFKEEPKKVSAVGELNEDGVDLVGTIVLEYDNNRRAVLNYSTRIALWNKATVYGSKGRATLEEPFHFPVLLTRADGSSQNFPLHESKIEYKWHKMFAGLVYQALEVHRCIKEGLVESPRMSHNDSLMIAKLEDAVRQQLGVHFDVDKKEYP